MSQVHALWTDNTVAANVRAELARHGLNANRLPKLLGSTQAYWSRRTRGEVAFDQNDLTALAALMQVDPGIFFAGAVDSWRARRDSNPQPSVLRSEEIPESADDTEQDAVVLDITDRLSPGPAVTSHHLAPVVVLR